MVALHRPRVPAQEILRINTIVGRARAHLSQEQLAERADVSRPTISRIERGVGDVGVDVVERIATALGITVADLFTPESAEVVDEAELDRRAAASDDEFDDARHVLDAVDEAAGRRPVQAPTDRYSRAGRPPLAR
jgi:transcriptional regulator with XRE-family HTH domain